ncbi:glycosyltransferase family 4 protein [Paenibacillus anseongense]|uniref:glycosyltransferase family 4 protein n=1 Tax=Paenibacillus anseongense TaxID=2682845 RepID=UPI002DBE5E8E|nr:glycosyltransferase family 4 protein [Paenibacillus anseongense]MEC0267545.1 glycosyltransferase family 4 protein [Paenibacillus anseongense]
MKIALVCPDSLPCPPIKSGAIELLIDRMAPYLSRLGHSVTIFSIQDPSLSNDERMNGVRFIRYDQSTYFNDVLSYCEKQLFDVVQLFNRPNWVEEMKSAVPAARVYLSLHNLLINHETRDQAALHAFELADHLITVSKFVAQDIIKTIPAVSSKITTFYTGEDPKRFTPHFTREGKKIAEKLKGELGIPPGFHVVLFVGRLLPKKGCHHLINAMKLVIRKYPKTALVIIGSKWYGDRTISTYVTKLRKRAMAVSSYIYFTNFIPVDRLPSYYTMSDVLVVPSQWQEPLARVQYEAMAAGIPIISSNRGGNPELVLNEKNGYIIDRYTDPRAYAQAIITLLSNQEKRIRIGRENRKLITDRYNFEKYAQRLSNLYQTT